MFGVLCTCLPMVYGLAWHVQQGRLKAHYTICKLPCPSYLPPYPPPLLSFALLCNVCLKTLSLHMLL